MNSIHNEDQPVTTALLLAAGTGSRLNPLTLDMPKCLTMVNGVSILERLVICLNRHGFKRLLVVTGHLENCIRQFLGTQYGGMTIDYILSPLYETTNNIYSLWMAREIIKEPFLLIESDIVFDVSLLDDMLCPDRIAVARMQPKMNGSTVTLDQFQYVKKFHSGAAGPLDEIRYKTVNIYSLSLFSWLDIRERLDKYISAGRVNNYYEAVFAEMVADGNLSLQAVFFDSNPWYEIDTIADLAEAEKVFSADRVEATTPYNITAHTSGISEQFCQQTMSSKAQTVSRSPSLMAVPQPNSLNMKPIYGYDRIQEEDVALAKKTTGNIDGEV